MRVQLRLFVLLACLTAVAGCGGGGGGSEATPADSSLLSGAYFVWAFAGEVGTPNQGNSAWAVATFDGAGMFSGAAGANEAGSISGPNAIMGTYTVAGDRATTLDFGGGDGFVGWTNAGGTVSLTSSTAALSTPRAVGLIKLGSGFADADLQGDWFVGALAVELAGNTVTFWGSASFDALGMGALSITGNDEGTVMAGAPVGLMAGVAGNGQLTLAAGGTDLEGALDASKNLFVATGSTSGMQGPLILVFVRKTAGASLATLTGPSQIVGTERDGMGFAGITGAAVSNGAGTISATFTKNTDGTISTSGPENVSYTAAADGALVVDPLGEPLEGGFSAGGAFAVIVGPNAAATNPRLYVLMRR